MTSPNPDHALTDEELTNTIGILQQFSCPVGQAPHVIGIIQKLAGQRDALRPPGTAPAAVVPDEAQTA